MATTGGQIESIPSAPDFRKENNSPIKRLRGRTLRENQKAYLGQGQALFQFSVLEISAVGFSGLRELEKRELQIRKLITERRRKDSGATPLARIRRLIWDSTGFKLKSKS